MTVKQSHLRIEEFFSSRNLPMIEEMRAGPSISLCGISLSNIFHNQEYKSTVKRLLREHREKLLTHRLKEIESMAEETTNKEDMSDEIRDLIESLTKITTVSQPL